LKIEKKIASAPLKSVSFLGKGQLISKQNCRAVTSPKKGMFIFLGEVMARQFCFEIYWPLARLDQNFDDYPGFQSKTTPAQRYATQGMCKTCPSYQIYV
jgi:hypothetical protein